MCSWYKTHSNTGILAGVRYVIFLSVPGFNLWQCRSKCFRAQDNDVHTESRIYYCKQLHTLSRFGLSSYFTISVEVLVDSIRHVCQRWCRSTHIMTTRNVENNSQSRGTNYKLLLKNWNHKGRRTSHSPGNEVWISIQFWWRSLHLRENKFIPHQINVTL